MPWWGWLIAGCVGFIGTLWVGSTVYVVRSVRKMALDVDPEKLRTNVTARMAKRWIGGKSVEYPVRDPRFRP